MIGLGASRLSLSFRVRALSLSVSLLPLAPSPAMSLVPFAQEARAKYNKSLSSEMLIQIYRCCVRVAHDVMEFHPLTP